MVTATPANGLGLCAAQLRMIPFVPQCGTNGMIIILIKRSALLNPGARLLAEGLAGLPASGHAAVRNETTRPGARSGTDSGTNGTGGTGVLCAPGCRRGSSLGGDGSFRTAERDALGPASLRNISY